MPFPLAPVALGLGSSLLGGWFGSKNPSQETTSGRQVSQMTLGLDPSQMAMMSGLFQNAFNASNQSADEYFRATRRAGYGGPEDMGGPLSIGNLSRDVLGGVRSQLSGILSQDPLSQTTVPPELLGRFDTAATQGYDLLSGRVNRQVAGARANAESATNQILSQVSGGMGARGLGGRSTVGATTMANAVSPIATGLQQMIGSGQEQLGAYANQLQQNRYQAFSDAFQTNLSSNLARRGQDIGGILGLGGQLLGQQSNMMGLRGQLDMSNYQRALANPALASLIGLGTATGKYQTDTTQMASSSMNPMGPIFGGLGQAFISGANWG